MSIIARNMRIIAIWRVVWRRRPKRRSKFSVPLAYSRVIRMFPQSLGAAGHTDFILLARRDTKCVVVSSRMERDVVAAICAIRTLLAPDTLRALLKFFASRTTGLPGMRKSACAMLCKRI